MMPFEVVEDEGRTLWVTSDGSSTFYKGQLVSIMAASKANVNGTVVPLAVPAGAADTTNLQVPLGVVTGFNRRAPLLKTVGSWQLEYDAGVVTQANQLAREYTGAEGMYQKGDPQALIQITEILPETMIRGRICKGACGTAVGVVTLTVVTGDGLITPATSTSADAAGIASMGTIYCRTGTNRGLYRVNANTSATAPAVTTAFPYAEAVGDTFVVVPLKQGNSTVYIDGPGLYIDSTAAPSSDGSNLFNIVVYKLSLATAGEEYAEFRFGGDHFNRYRA